MGLVLKCGSLIGPPSGCGQFVHLKCSQLPSFYLVRYELTRVSYLCKDCICLKGGEEYNVILRQIEDILNESESENDSIYNDTSEIPVENNPLTGGTARSEYEAAIESSDTVVPEQLEEI